MVAMDSRNRRDGAAIEELGWYNPIDSNHSYDLKDERILHWLGEGAQPTDAAKVTSSCWIEPSLASYAAGNGWIRS